MKNPFYTKLIFVAICLCIGSSIWATHNRAGEITYEQIGDLTIRATITTYTKTSSIDADRDSLQVFWGDNTNQQVYRINGAGSPIENDIKINYYIAEHTYPGRGTYTISMTDPNRVANILNVNFPNSVNVPFYLETTFTFLNAQFQGYNNSAILLQEPIDFACTNEIFKHNPNAYDPDGDSLSYSLDVPGQSVDMGVPDYSFPDEIAPGSDNILDINPITGQITWNAPKLQGEYNIAIRINEYREGVLINSLVRDMQIFVRACEDSPPVITAIDEICVIAGETINIPILVDDADIGQLVKLEASGGPFTQVDNPAQLNVLFGFNPTVLEGNFVWQTTCNDVSERYYQVVFRAVDNLLDTTGLADLKTLRIKVVAPPPLDVQAESKSNQIALSWELPYACEFTDDEYFQGFSVWRKEGSHTIGPDSCNTGLDNTPYQKIIFLTNNNDRNRYTEIDNNVEKGITYCYRVLAEFAKNTPTGNPFNKVQSLPSDEVCLQIFRDVPLITNISVETTDNATGSILVRWTKPLAADLDTLENPGPYRYRLMRSELSDTPNFSPVAGADFTVPTFAASVDTMFMDSGINTQSSSYLYQVEFYSADLNNPYGSSATASSIFLETASRDKGVDLTWTFEVPWSNIQYGIFRFDPINNQFDSIGMTTDTRYNDRELENGIEYCYKIKAFDSYGIQSIDEPLINFSQESCTVPIDNEGPCPPELQVSNICNADIDLIDVLSNELLWSRPDLVCGNNDVMGYNIYFAASTEDPRALISTVDGFNNNTTMHNPDNGIAGCYQVSALDSSGNEGELSNLVCVDNCPTYALPNTFTPNQDGTNDLFVPISNRFIASIELAIFNRWGGKVFETNDPQINWNGTNLNAKDLEDGVYFYTCKVFEERVAGVTQSTDIISGYIHLIR